MERQSYRELATVGVMSYGDRNFCTVVALAATLNWSFGKAHRWMRKHGGRKNGQGMFEGVWAPVIKQAADSVGLKFESTDHHRDPKTGRPMTLTRFCREYPKGTFYLKVRGHAVAVVDGVMIDWTAETAGRRKVLSCYMLQGEQV